MVIYYLSAILIFQLKFQFVFPISCYQCSSINGSNPLCDDTFQKSLMNVSLFLRNPCLTNLRGRQGLFPATHCVKLVAYSGEPNSIRYTYRTCSRDDGEENSITRTSHCGLIKLEWINPNRRFRGCLHICDKDACNQAQTSSLTSTFFTLLLLSTCNLYGYFSYRN